MNILLIGDIVGKPGRRAVRACLPKARERLGLDFIIANGENAAGGFGITETVAEELFSLGIDVITSGNHIWDKKEAVEYLARESRVLRPLNYPAAVPGFGSIVHTLKDGTKVAVMNVSGRVFMPDLDCPFRTVDAELEKLAGVTENIIVDFHAEATSEKEALGYYLAGSVSAVLCTHTHVQTADEKVLAGGTAYITDVGMTGPEDSVIGVKKELVIERFLTMMPARFETAKGPSLFSAVVVELDGKTGRASSITRVQDRNP
jgi:metallophosphoesterase (TIGR00282 family)